MEALRDIRPSRFSTDLYFYLYLLLLENAHSSINMDSMKKAKHILGQNVAKITLDINMRML